MKNEENTNEQKGSFKEGFGFILLMVVVATAILTSLKLMMN